MNFQMFKLDLEKAEEPEINFKYPLDHRKASITKTSGRTNTSHYAKAFDCVDDNKLWKILKEMGLPDRLT